MKKDGIQTRNRKMSTKSKKNKKLAAMDLLKSPFDKFSGVPTMNHPMHAPMPTYMTGGGSFGSSFLTHGGHHMQGSAGGMGGFANSFPSSLQSSFSSSFSNIPNAPTMYSSGLSSGLNLSTSSNMVGAAMA